jgi:hypothetical protein
MKKLTMFVGALAVAGLLVALASPVFAGGKTHKMTAEIVSVDIEGKTITIKDDKGEQKTAPVLGKAADDLKSLKAGEKVELTCQDNEKGEHEGVAAIRVMKEKKA